MRLGERDANTPHDPTVAAIIRGLEQIGYRGQLLQENYAFPDWFEGKQERRLVAAAFAQTPVSYESACLGVVRADGLREHALVNGFRSFGAPILLEIDAAEVREWAVSARANAHVLIARFPSDQIDSAISQRAQDWKPEVVLRAKNIGAFNSERQLNLFSGLLPELENQIQEQLDPMLRGTLSDTRNAYVETSGRNPTSEQLFKLVFWILTAKVFHDRQFGRFTGLAADADALIAAVARHYKTDVPKLLNRAARDVAARAIWADLDFRNLSVEVLSQIWSTTLVDEKTRRELGIHRTSRTIVRYIIERIPFSPSSDDNAQIVFEPCSGTAAFLVGAMHALRQKLFGASPEERHEYFVKHLGGTEYDPFGVEISTLALTLADFPNPNGWQMERRDVFVPGAMSDYLRRAGVVLCNPPFETFTSEERARYQHSSVMKPAELLNRVLDDLHPSGVLGFVLPFVAVDGKAYKKLRERLAHRFASLELTVLPDRAFKADAEVALLVATDPIPHDVCRVTYRRVNDDAPSWERFERQHDVSSDFSANFGTSAALAGFTIPALQDVWSFLLQYPRFETVAKLSRGLEWKRGLNTVQSQPAPGHRLGVAPRTRFRVFEQPPMRYLSVRQEDQRRGAWQHDWAKPKVIFNKSAKSRGRWRIAAFPDRDGVTCFQTFFGAWPQSPEYDEVVLAAVLNGPIANAFVSAREGKTDITMETLRLIPMPIFTAEQRGELHALVARYQKAIHESAFALMPTADDSELLLKRIDAVVLRGYRLPPRLERQALDYFNGYTRPTAHEFNDYFPKNFDVFCSLTEYLDPSFMGANAGELLKTIRSR